ncbi:unnamed protein product [Peniophora sp. CBMAI 1063]|nr:unnamed protein product [Peniophora sp. CBMAI 1063]
MSPISPPNPSPVPSLLGQHRTSSSQARLSTDRDDGSLDLVPLLQRSGPSIVKSRNGSVLSRGFILKTDFYPSGRALELDLNVHGAPNFRAPRQGDLNVFGAAQPRSQGLRAILSVLRARPGVQNPSHVVWFSTREEPIVYISGRPFVLRDSSEPRKTLRMSDRAENLEAIEHRLKADILAESAKYGGLLLTHNEVAVEDGDGAILPTWTAVDGNNVRTSRELWEHLATEGWHVEYHRVPISPDRPIEDNYIDAYLRVIKNLDPLRTSLVFSCGMGAVRTTFAMTTACIFRRRQLMLRGLPDPYGSRLPHTPSRAGTPISGGANTPTQELRRLPAESKVVATLEQASLQQDMNRSLLRLTYVLQQCLPASAPHHVIEILLSHPSLLDSLRRAHMGSYGIVLSLLGLLDDGQRAKKLVDKVIDNVDHVVNLREDILVHRVRYSLSTLEEGDSGEYLAKAARALEKYFFLISFASYVDAQTDFKTSFVDWLKPRTEIWNQILFLRKSHGSRLNVFAPVHDLTALSRSGSMERATTRGHRNDVQIAGGEMLGDEYSEYVVKTRAGVILREGMLLKSDQWLGESAHVEAGVRGAINFRRVPGTSIYALGQPAVEAIDEVVRRIRQNSPGAEKIVWVALREEPLVYVNGAPYCLRRERFSLRNMKDYGGISASRLETLEERLRDDVVSEVHSFGGKLLLHTEVNDGAVIPVWEDARPGDVAVLKEVMNSRRTHPSSDGLPPLEVSYVRIPITAEHPPDFSDFGALIALALSTDMANTPVVLNDQLGRGRASLAAVILVLVQNWLHRDRETTAPMLQRSQSMSRISGVGDAGMNETPIRRQSYQVINNVLRVVRKGPAIKNAVDEAIDQCGEVFNIRDSIEEARIKCEQATDSGMQKMYAQRGIQNLRRYFELIVFAAYLQSTEPDTISTSPSFETFVKSLPVLKTFEKELTADGMAALRPLVRVDIGDGLALPDEVSAVVSNRAGSILSQSTILKSDFFSNLQKMSLPERIDGAPNFRRVPLVLHLAQRGEDADADVDFVPGAQDSRWVCGSGMPTVQGLRRALARIDAGPEGSNTAVWTSLREEPVLYVAGRPHVLRLVDRPLENVEATGVTTDMVERMEANLKRDVIEEVRAGNGRVLLHDEVEERPGHFAIVPIWETVAEDDIMTPRDVFELMERDGYKIDYGRVAITDEQAPLPAALAQLFDRVASRYDSAGDFIFNCQMGRGRTTTGMVSASLIATTMHWKESSDVQNAPPGSPADEYDYVEGASEEEAYLQGEYKSILQLVGILSHGKVAKKLTDRSIDLMQDVQNLRKAIYDNKLKVEACEKGTNKYRKLFNLAINYLYRYAMLIVFANYLIERREDGNESSFPSWLAEHREIKKILDRRSLD